MIAVSAWFDEPGEARVREVWRRMAEAGVDGSLAAGPYRPHVTLGVWETLLPDEATARLRGLGARALPLVFRSLGVFPGEDAGVYLVPVVTHELRELHERVHAALDGIATGPVDRHVPGRWEPHCTVAWRLDAPRIRGAVEVALDAEVLPLQSTVTRLGVIETPAEVELECVSLP